MRRLLESNAAFKLPSGLHKERVQWLYDGSASSSATTPPQHLLYWMQTSVRTKYNYSLEYAIAAANALALPLRVIYFLSDLSVVPESHRTKDPNAYGLATERHAKFGLEGLRAVHTRLQQRGLSFHVFHHTHMNRHKSTSSAPPTRSDLLDMCAREAALVVTDRPYLRPWREALDACALDAETHDRAWGLVEVEGDVVVPCNVVSDKEEYAARTIRPKITRQLGKFLVPLDHIDVAATARSTVVNSSVNSSSDAAAAATTAAWLTRLLEPDAANTNEKPLTLLDVATQDVATLLNTLDLDRSVRGVDTFVGGESVAVELAKRFLTHKLATYADARNEPSGDGGSDLSIYLHYGHISPVRITLAANKVTADGNGVATAAGVAAGRASFLEELIVRRELSVNLVVFNAAAYDSIECLPPYAKTTLREHTNDPRVTNYTFEQLEAAQTYDVYWNAAQREVVATGKMHGYMRMYWGKKILEWTPTPEAAYNAALLLNNKYALDAPDANSYAGIAWTFGKHDQGWKERPIFGKVRYMNEAGLKRKFRMDAYVAKVQALAAAYDGGGVAGTSAAATHKRKTIESFLNVGDDNDENPVADAIATTKKAKSSSGTAAKTTTKAKATRAPPVTKATKQLKIK